MGSGPLDLQADLVCRRYLCNFSSFRNCRSAVKRFNQGPYGTRMGGGAMTELDVDLGALLPADLPDGREAVEEGKALAPGIERGRSLFCEEKGVGSEREWREKA